MRMEIPLYRFEEMRLRNLFFRLVAIRCYVCFLVWLSLLCAARNVLVPVVKTLIAHGALFVGVFGLSLAYIFIA